jgi:hypothetical protein
MINEATRDSPMAESPFASMPKSTMKDIKKGRQRSASTSPIIIKGEMMAKKA